MDIKIEEDIKLLGGDKCVYLKKDCFHIGELNYYTVMKMLKIKNEALYNELLLNKELSRYAINSIIFENKDIKPIDIFKYINSISSTNLFFMGNEYKEYLDEFLRNNNFQLSKFKALLYADSNVDTLTIFKEFPNLQVLFLYNADTEELQIINRNGTIIKKKKISESDLIVDFDEFKEKQIKELANSYWNKMLYDILKKFFDLAEFFSDFEEEIINRLLSILSIVDLEEETLKKLEELEKENSFPEKFSKALAKKIKQRDNKLEKKYGTRVY